MSTPSGPVVVPDGAARTGADDPHAAIVDVMDVQERRRLVAAELSRLAAVLEQASLIAQELGVTTDDRAIGLPPAAGPRAALPPGETIPLPKLRWNTAGTGSDAPLEAKVTEWNRQRLRGPSVRDVRRRRLAVMAAGAVAVVLLGAFVVPRAGDPTEGPATTAAAAAEGAPAVPDPVDLPQAPPTPAAIEPVGANPSNAALEAIFSRAKFEREMTAGTVALVERLPGLTVLEGVPRAEEAADIFGIAVAEAREGPGAALAGELVGVLRPEVTLESLLVLAERRPAVVGAGVAPLLERFAGLEQLSGAAQRREASLLLDAVVAGVEAGTISGSFYNVADHVLQPYLASA